MDVTLRASSRKAGRTFAAICVVLASIAAACGSEDDDGDPSSSTPDSVGDPASTSAPGDSGVPAETGSAPSGEPVRIVVGSSTEPALLDPCVSDAGTEMVTTTINQQLVDFDADGALIPVLAAELPATVDGDGTRWRIPLREGVEFTNGEAFDAEAVKLNIDRMLAGDETGCTLNKEFGTMNGAEVVDEHTIDILTAEEDPIFDYRLSLLRIVAPAQATALEASNEPIGTGPFQLAEWNQGTNLVITKNENYWGDTDSQVTEVEFRFFPDDGTRIAALQAGELDLAQNVPPDTPDIPQFIASSTFIRLGTIFMNLEMPPFNDVRFRQALNYAIDKQAMSDALFAGQAPPNDCQMVDSTSAGYNDAVEAYPYDPDKATELLAEVDIPEGFVATITAAGVLYPREKEIMETVRSYWEAVGLDAVVDYVPLETFGEVLYSGGENLASSPNQMIYIEDDNALNNMSRKIDVWWKRTAPTSWIGTQVPEMDPLIDQALTSLDGEERLSAMQDLANLGCEEALFVFLLARPDWWAASSRINYEPTFGTLSHFAWDRIEISG